MFWQRFYDLCISKDTKPNPVAKIVGISSATVTQWKQGAIPAGDNLAKIADYLDCSVDYLLGRTDNPQSHKSPAPSVSVGDVSGNSGAIGVNNTIMNAVPQTDRQTAALLEVFGKLDPIKQAKLLVYADELNRNGE